MAARDTTLRYIGEHSSAVRSTDKVARANQDMERRIGGSTKKTATHFRGMGDNFARTGQRILRLGTLAAAGGVVALGAGLVSAFKAADEARKVGKQTEQVIKTMGASSWTSAGQISNFSERLAQLTGVDDEIIQQGANLILTFKGIQNQAGKGNDIFDRTVTLANDMSVALGQDMKSSSIQLGKALNDPIRGVTALRRVGVSFTDAQLKQIKVLTESGDLLGAQRLILKEVESQFGGTAKAVATPWDRLRVTLGNLQEKIGTALFPILERAVALFNAYLPEAIAVARTAFDRIRDAFGRVVKALRPIVEAIVGFFQRNPTSAFAALGAVIGGVLLAGIVAVGVAIYAAIGPLVVITAAVAALAAGVAYAYTRWGWFRDAVNAVISWVTGTAIPGIQDFAAAFMETFRGIGEAVGHAMTVIRDIISVVIGVITALWRTFGDTILAHVQAVWGVISSVIAGFLGVIRGVIQFVLAVINGDWGRAWEAVKLIFASIWQTILGILGNVLASMKSTLSLAWEGIKTAASLAWGWVRDKISGFWTKIKSDVVTAANWVKSKLAGIWDSIKKKVSGVWEGIKNGLSNVWDSIRGVIVRGVNRVIGIINGLIRGVNWVLRKLKIPEIPEINKLQDMSGNQRGAQLNRPTREGMAAGGVVPLGRSGPFVTNGPMTVVGEGRRSHPEYVIPTDPQYRGRALGLLGQLSSQLLPATARLPGLQFGGIVGAFKGGFNFAKDKLGGLAGSVLRKALEVGFAPFNAAAKAGLNALPNPFGVRDIAQKVRESVWEWVKGADSALPTKPPGGGRARGAGLFGLHEPVASMAKRLLELANGQAWIISGWRSFAQQQALYARYLAGTGNLAAKPGTSKHEQGLAVDWGGTQSVYQSIWRSLGGHFPVRGEPWHGEAIGYRNGTNFVPRDGMYRLHRGEAVTPARANRGVTVNITVQGSVISERELTEVITRNLARQNGRSSVRVR